MEFVLDQVEGPNNLLRLRDLEAVITIDLLLLFLGRLGKVVKKGG